MGAAKCIGGGKCMVAGKCMIARSKGAGRGCWVEERLE
jgi:hypothetical protein